MTYHSFSSYHNTYVAYANTYATFYDGIFCGGTWIDYDPITLNGFGSGAADGAVYTYDYGCDASWLSWYSYLW
jgi:hypothetical protein